MNSRAWMIMLGLLYSCHSLPISWDFSDVPQTYWSRNQEVHRSISIWKLPTTRFSKDASRDNAIWNLPYSREQSKPPLFQAHQGHVRQDNKSWLYFTDIEFGNPPQSFRAVIDIGWSDTFVPSISCADPDCANHRLYNNARSSSYRKNGTAVRMHYSGFYTSGFASIDTLRIGDLTIENQAFEEATELKAVPLWDDIFDSVLGLPRLQVDDEESSLRASSPFHNMIQQGLLRRNLFSLKLPNKDADESGELLFENVNSDLYIGSLISFPVSIIFSIDRRVNAFLAPGWQVDAHSIAYRYDREIANFTLIGHVAAFSTVFPYISLPRAIGENILHYLGADVSHRVECDRRESLPDLVISLGYAAVPFVLKPHNYIREDPQWEWNTACQVEIILHDEPEDGVKYIILGSAFLSRWYSVFDWDNSQISLADLKNE